MTNVVPLNDLTPKNGKYPMDDEASVLDSRQSYAHQLRRDGARRRVTATYGPFIGYAVAANQFDRCIETLESTGVSGSGLIIAAERMAAEQLRAHVRGRTRAPIVPQQWPRRSA